MLDTLHRHKTSLIPLLNPNVLRLSAIVHQRHVDKTSEWKTIINFFASLLCHSTNRALFLFVSRAVFGHRSKHTHTRFINSRDKDHPIMNRRIERITYQKLYTKEIPCWCCRRAQCRPLCKRWWIEWSVNACWMSSVNRSPASPPTVAVELSRRTNSFWHRLAACARFLRVRVWRIIAHQANIANKQPSHLAHCRLQWLTSKFRTDEMEKIRPYREQWICLNNSHAIDL